MKICSKFFLKMTPPGVKICEESEFDIFEAKKRFPDSGKAHCVLKRKVAEMRFLPKNDKKCGEAEFDIYKTPRIQEKLYIDAKIRENNIFWSKNNDFSFPRTFFVDFRQKSHFCDFSLQYTIRLP